MNYRKLLKKFIKYVNEEMKEMDPYINIESIGSRHKYITKDEWLELSKIQEEVDEE
jgi:hypothetical protein